MKSTLAALTLMACLTILLATVRTARLRNGWRFLGVAVATFVGAQLVLSVAASQARIAPPSELARVVAGAAADPADARPELVIIGSSYSSRGLDGRLLERLLAEHGLDLRILQFTYPGAYAYEQDFQLNAALRATARPPAAVLVELGSEHAVIETPENRFKPQVIGYRDAERSAWMLRQVWQGSHLSTRLNETLEIVLHSLAHYTHLGFLRSAVVGAPLPVSGFQPEESSPTSPSETSIRQALAKTLPAVANPAATAFRRHQSSTWNRQGVNTVLFYQPPMASAERRAVVAGICQDLAPDCLPANPALLAALNGGYWTDLGHLNSAGAERWTRAMADALIHDGRLRSALQ